MRIPVNCANDNCHKELQSQHHTDPHFQVPNKRNPEQADWYCDRLCYFDQRLNRQEGQIEGIHDTLDDIDRASSDSRIGRLEDDLGNRIDHLENSVDGLTSRVEGLEDSND